jgi:hypothetical protein
MDHSREGWNPQPYGPRFRGGDVERSDFRVSILSSDF